MGQALYRKYRSKSLDEVIGQEHITQTLKQALKLGRISHAYLFTGPRGVGKTSIARIWAHEINGLPYTDDSVHLDIIEIDAASNRRIDEIRELRDKVYMAPLSAKYKVYIIDEVHMLTREAFNALLKTLEEPPAHVVFILATTDAHKLPDTIVSRTQRFSFKPAEKKEVMDLLRTIAKSEGLTVSDEALELLAEHGEGSFRDSISLLDQARNQGTKIEGPAVTRLLGIPPNETLQELAAFITNGSGPAELMSAIRALYDQGYQAAAIAKRLGQTLRVQVIEDESVIEPEDAFQLFSQLIEVPVSHDPERFLEIILLRANAKAYKSQPSASAVESAKPEVQNPEPVKTAVKPAAKATESKSNKTSTSLIDVTVWPEVLQALKLSHNTLYGVVRMARADFSQKGKLKLAFTFAFHQKRIKENSNQQKLAETILKITGETVAIEAVVDKSANPFKTEDTSVKISAGQSNGTPPVTDLSSISNIFGDAELLES